MQPSQPQQYNQFRPFPQTSQLPGLPPYNQPPIPGIAPPNQVSSQKTPFYPAALPMPNPLFMHSQQVILPKQQLNDSLNQFRNFSQTKAAAPMVTPVLSTPLEKNPNDNLIPQIIQIARQNTQLSGEYVFHKVLGEGSYGVAVMYKRTSTEQDTDTIAAKFDKPPTPGQSQPVSSMMKESYYLQSMQSKNPKLKHIMKYYGEQYFNNKSFVLIECLDYSIPEYLKRPSYPQKLNLIGIAKQMVDAIKEMHDLGFLHQDIKPDNFRIHNDTVKLLDFGLVNEYMPNGNHKEQGRYGFQGTPMFGSIHSLDGFTLSRRDDLESIGYTIMFLQNENQIPWKDQINTREILSSKRNFLNKQKNQYPNIYEGIRIFIDKANSLQFQQVPDYEDFKKTLDDLYIFEKRQEMELIKIVAEDYVGGSVLKEEVTAIASDAISQIKEEMLLADALQNILDQIVKEVCEELNRELQIDLAEEVADKIVATLLQNECNEYITDLVNDLEEKIRVKTAQESLAEQACKILFEQIQKQEWDEGIIKLDSELELKIRSKNAQEAKYVSKAIIEVLLQETIEKHQVIQFSAKLEAQYKSQLMAQGAKSEDLQFCTPENESQECTYQNVDQDTKNITKVICNGAARYEIDDDYGDSWRAKFDSYFKAGNIVTKQFGYKVITKRTVDQFTDENKKYLYNVMKNKGIFSEQVSSDSLQKTRQNDQQTSQISQEDTKEPLDLSPKIEDLKSLTLEMQRILSLFNDYEKHFGRHISGKFHKQIFNKKNYPSLMENIAIVEKACLQREEFREDKLKVGKLLEIFIKELSQVPSQEKKSKVPQQPVQKIVLDFRWMLDDEISLQNKNLLPKERLNKKEVRFILTREDSLKSTLDRLAKAWGGLSKHVITALELELIISKSADTKLYAKKKFVPQKMIGENEAWICDIILEKNISYLIQFEMRFKKNDKSDQQLLDAQDTSINFWIDHNPQPFDPIKPPESFSLPPHKKNTLVLTDD
ncbi:hypothetical protein FGO68_gene13904 [Halteria grandinella]|uniref:Casein kinase I n=1 Tax=Halteria grandinella TaxID=5974 RepID=A0A8J8P289_HALGN|nr:hypothetical protein FGO68_gene13904 [Halteria grandinella]